MRWLNRAHREESGATLVLVAISMVALFALVGLAIDGGALFAERRELSRGADAAVLAIAEDCVLDAKPCTDDQALVTADEYADANAEDQASAIDGLDLDTSEATVYVRTKSFDPSDGTDTFKFFFMPVVGIDSTTVIAEATAQWGVAAGGPTIPITISTCEWDKYAPGGEVVTLTFQGGANTEPCNAQAGQDADGDGSLPGGFGWLDTPGDCEALVQSGGWVDADPGQSPSTGCSASELRELILDKTVAITVFSDEDGIEGQGAGGRYRIYALAPFHVLGYNFGGQWNEAVNTDYSCKKAPDSCLVGYFADELVIYDGQLDPGGTPDLGVYIVKLIG